MRLPPTNMASESGPSDTQFWARIHVLDVTSDECFSAVSTLLTCPYKTAVARSLEGSEAQSFVDFLDRVLAQSHVGHNLRHRALLLLSKICKARTIIPSSYIIQRDLIRVGQAYYHGGFAEVSDGDYMGSPVAIKRLKMNAGDADKIFKRLCREIIGWKHLSHPNILPLLGVSLSTDPYCFHILTNWMANGNVIQYTKSNPGANRLRLLFEAASGVVYLHELGIVHGDLKGANILVDNNGTACLADFGLTTVLIEHSSIPLSVSAVSFAGTVRWMSPELLFDQYPKPTRQSDCYALGMVIYEVLTGLRPFHHLGPFAMVVAVQKGKRPRKPPNLETLCISSVLWKLLIRCWNKSPATRPTAQQLVHCLESGSHTWVSPPDHPSPDSPKGEQYLGLLSTTTGVQYRGRWRGIWSSSRLACCRF